MITPLGVHISKQLCGQVMTQVLWGSVAQLLQKFWEWAKQGTILRPYMAAVCLCFSASDNKIELFAIHQIINSRNMSGRCVFGSLHSSNVFQFQAHCLQALQVCTLSAIEKWELWTCQSPNRIMFILELSKWDLISIISLHLCQYGFHMVCEFVTLPNQFNLCLHLHVWLPFEISIANRRLAGFDHLSGNITC